MKDGFLALLPGFPIIIAENLQLPLVMLPVVMSGIES